MAPLYFNETDGMMCLNHLILDVNEPHPHEGITAKQNDNDSRFIEVTLKDELQIIFVPDDSIAALRATKPDGTTVMLDGMIDDGKIYIRLKEQLLALPGRITADIAVYRGENEDEILLSSQPFYINVVEAPFDENAPESSDDFSALTAAVCRAQEAIASANEQAQAIAQARENGEFDGKDGIDGKDGSDGKDGKDGKDGSDGASAYDIARQNGFEDNEAAWLESLKGKDGNSGNNGLSMYYCLAAAVSDTSGLTPSMIQNGGRTLQVGDLLLMTNGRVYAVRIVDDTIIASYTGITLKGAQGEQGPPGTAAQPDWAQNDDTQPDYVKNRTHWVETSGEASVVEILPETVLEEPSIMFEGEDISTSFVEGETYTVTWNGVEYDTLCQYVTSAGITLPVLGDIYTASEGNVGTAATGEPFAIVVYTPEMLGGAGSGLEITPFEEITELTISITGKSGAVITYHPLDKRFIPAHWLANRREVTRTIASGVTSLSGFHADQFENAIELYITFELNGETITDTLKVTATDKYGTFLGASGEYFNFTNYSMSPTGDVSVWWNPGENWPESYTVSGKFYEYDKVPFNYLTSVELDLTDYDTSQTSTELGEYLNQVAIALRHGVTVRYKGGTLLAAYGDVDMGYWSITWADDYGVHHEGCYFGSDLPRSAEIPAVTADDEGKVLKVVNGVWTAVSEE